MLQVCWGRHNVVREHPWNGVVMEKLAESGISVNTERSSIQCGHEPERDNYPNLTPDILISDSKVCVEVDTAYTHGDEEAKDRTRNALLAEVGWQVVRLRLGGLEPIGEHDVVVEHSSVTKEVIVALVTAVSDAVAGRAGTVRRIQKKKGVTPRNKSRLGAIAEHKYYDNAFYVSWELASDEVLRMVAMDSGCYLARADGSGAPRFVCHVGLHQIPRAQWRGVLEPLLRAMDEANFVPVSTFPWGDELFIGEQSAAINISSKFNLGAPGWGLTANLVGVDSWTAVALCAGDTALAQLHPEAVDAGWWIAGVEARTGYRGPYQAIQLERADERGDGGA